MTSEIPMPEFEQLADIYWRLGVMQSPSQLHGYLVGLLAVGDGPDSTQWVEQASAYIDAVQPPDNDDSSVLLALQGATSTQLKAGDMGLQLLLPDDAVEITQRVDSIGQWCQGFMVGFAQGGKTVQQEQGQQQYSSDVSEALSDLAAISQISLSDDDEDPQQREQNIFEVSEYIRLAAITVYIECHQQAASEGVIAGKPNGVSADDALGAPGSLFSKKNKTLH